MSKLVKVVGLLGLLVAGSAQAEHWTLQSMVEAKYAAVSSVGGGRMMVICPNSSSVIISVTDEQGNYITTADYDQRQVSVALSIDGREYREFGETGSHAGGNETTYLLNALRKGKTVTVRGYGIQPTTFTLDGAATAIGIKDCHTDWQLEFEQ